ncbi:MAG: kinase-like domain-containing protein [Piptocephalis tieghemiana]|nr:MAG: kinase-like domain-containing protein [Piptocephalis tieghemiana]
MSLEGVEQGGKGALSLTSPTVNPTPSVPQVKKGDSEVGTPTETTVTIDPSPSEPVSTSTLTTTPTTPTPTTTTTQDKSHSSKSLANTLTPALAEKYALCRELAIGGFGKVYMGVRKGTDIQVIIKFVQGNEDVEKDKLHDPVLGWLPREAYFMLRLSSISGVVHLMDMDYLPEKGHVMVMEMAGAEWRWMDPRKKQLRVARDLMGLIKQYGRLEHRHAHYIFRSIIDTVYRLHARGIHHGDLKCLNVLVNERFEVKICDFGATTEKDQPGPSYFAGTRIFSPPEVLLNARIDPELLESWSLGVILYTMYHGVAPYRHLEDIVDPLHQPAWMADDMEAKTLCRALMRKGSSRRMRLREAWLHPWVGFHVGNVPSDDAHAWGSSA